MRVPCFKCVCHIYLMCVCGDGGSGGCARPMLYVCVSCLMCDGGGGCMCVCVYIDY